MQKIIFILILCFSFGIPTIFAYSDPVNDTTVIDCIIGNDDTGVAFDSNHPYQTLKAGIEKTIIYINANINIPGNEASFSGQIFKIQVNCSANDALNNTIYLNFKGNDYHNELLIEGSGSNALVFQDVTLIQKYNMGNVIFKNAKFMNTDMPYFEDENANPPKNNGLKCQNCFFQLNNKISLGSTFIYKIVNLFYGFSYYYDYANQQNIQDSVLEISLNGDYTFQMPVNIQNTKIKFVNQSPAEVYNIRFTQLGITESSLNYANAFSNEFDFGGNNVAFQDNSNISFINNHFFNFKTMSFPSQTIFLNNTIENPESIDISNAKNVYNNTFSGTLVDTVDTKNVRKNYSNGQVLIKGIGWVLKRKNILPYFNLDISSYTLFKTITGVDIPNLYDGIYKSFQK